MPGYETSLMSLYVQYPNSINSICKGAEEIFVCCVETICIITSLRFEALGGFLLQGFPFCFLFFIYPPFYWFEVDQVSENDWARPGILKATFRMDVIGEGETVYSTPRSIR